MIHKLRFISDPGHGWLEVPENLFRKSGMSASPFSYYNQSNDCVYLEEDCDAKAFTDAIKKQGDDIKVEHLHSNKASFVRSLNRLVGKR